MASTEHSLRAQAQPGRQCHHCLCVFLQWHCYALQITNNHYERLPWIHGGRVCCPYDLLQFLEGDSHDGKEKTSVPRRRRRAEEYTIIIGSPVLPYGLIKIMIQLCVRRTSRRVELGLFAPFEHATTKICHLWTTTLAFRKLENSWVFAEILSEPASPWVNACDRHDGAGLSAVA